MTLAQDTAKSAKQLARDVAKKIAREPLEILKDTREQITGETLDQPENSHGQSSDDQQKQIGHEKELADKIKSERLVEALNRELSDIQKQRLFSDLQKRISDGEEIPIEDFQELPYEQREVLKAQMEAYQNQKLNIKNQNEKRPLFGSSKPSRRFGQKQAAEKEQTRVEKPVPPSG